MTRTRKRRRFIDTYNFPDGRPGSAGTATDWEKSAHLHERQANKLWRLSERCLQMAEKLRKRRGGAKAPKP
jgi:hypothetical protein